MEKISIEQFNELVLSGSIIDAPVYDETVRACTTTLNEEDNVNVYRIGNALAIHWPTCGHLCTLYVK